MAIYGPYMTIYGPYMGHICPYMDHMWTYMGHTWPYMAMYGHIWTIYPHKGCLVSLVLRYFSCNLDHEVPSVLLSRLRSGNCVVQ